MKRIGVFTAAIVASLALGACGSAQDPYDAQSAGPSSGAQGASTASGDTVTVGLTYIPNVQFSPVYVAEADGIYHDAGLDVTIRHHGSDEGLFTALAAGKEDVVVASGDEVLQARDQGMDLVSIGAYYRKYPVTVIVPEDSTIHSLADLKGHSIGVPGEFGSSWYGLLAGLDSAGLSASDVDVVSIGYTQQAALTAGKVDAIVGFTNNDLVQLRQAGMHVRTVDLPEDTPLVGASLITTRTWLDAHPEQATAVVDATVSGISRVVADPQHAVDVTKQWDDTLSEGSALSTARAVLDATTDLFEVDGKVSGVQDLYRWKQMGTFLTTVPGLLSHTPDVAAAVTNDHVTR